MNRSLARFTLVLLAAAAVSQDAEAAAQAPSFSQVFSPDATTVGGTSTLTFTIDNTASAMAATSLDFTDNLPAGLTVGSPANASTTCTGGTLTAVSGTGVVSYTGGTVSAGATCTLSVDTTPSSAGGFLNVTGDLTSSAGNSGSSSDTLTVDPAPAFAATFAPSSIAAGGVSTLTFTVDNSASTSPATSLDFTNTLPAGVVVASPANASVTCTGGTLTAVQGTATINYSGASVAAGATCTAAVDVTAAMGGVYANTTGDLTSSLGNSGSASDTLTANAAPGFTAAFSPDAVAVDGVSTLTFTIDNGGATVSATSLDFTNNLPAGVVIAAPANASTTCTGGTLTAAAGAGTITYSGGSVAAGATCAVVVDVTASLGSFVNVSGDLTSSLGNSGSAMATLSTNDAPGFSLAFAPALVALDVAPASTITWTIDNTAGAVMATDLAFTHTLPDGIAVVIPLASTNTCGGSFNVALMGGVISLSSGSVSAGATCTISVDVEAVRAGALENMSGELTSSFGSSGIATGTLTADPVPAAVASLTSVDVEPDGQTTFALTLDNSGATQAATGVGFTLDLPTGITAGMPAMTSTTCASGTASVGVSGGEQLSFSGGEVPAGMSCVVTLTLFGALPGEYSLTTSAITTSLGSADPDSVMLTVEGPLTLTKVFSDATITLGDFVVATYTIDNSGGYLAVSDIGFTESLPSTFEVTEGSTPSTDCPGATLTVAGGALSLSGGSLDAGATCTVTVRYTPTLATSYTTYTSQLTSSAGAAPGAQAMLVVEGIPNEGSSCSAGAPRGASPWWVLMALALLGWRRRRR